MDTTELRKKIEGLRPTEWVEYLKAGDLAEVLDALSAAEKSREDAMADSEALCAELVAAEKALADRAALTLRNHGCTGGGEQTCGTCRAALPPSIAATEKEAPCAKCGQSDVGQVGEYPCSACGLPTLWDKEYPGGHPASVSIAATEATPEPMELCEHGHDVPEWCRRCRHPGAAKFHALPVDPDADTNRLLDAFAEDFREVERGAAKKSMARMETLVASAEARRAQSARSAGECETRIIDGQRVAVVQGTDQEWRPPVGAPTGYALPGEVRMKVTRAVRPEVDLSEPASEAPVKEGEAIYAARRAHRPGPASEKNQCDGCCAGRPVDANGKHRMGEPGKYPNFQACEAGKYAQPASEAHPRTAALTEKVDAQREEIESLRSELASARANVAKLKVGLRVAGEHNAEMQGEIDSALADLAQAVARTADYKREVERRDELLAASSPAAIAEQVEHGVRARHGALVAELAQTHAAHREALNVAAAHEKAADQAEARLAVVEAELADAQDDALERRLRMEEAQAATMKARADLIASEEARDAARDSEAEAMRERDEALDDARLRADEAQRAIAAVQLQRDTLRTRLSDAEIAQGRVEGERDAALAREARYRAEIVALVQGLRREHRPDQLDVADVNRVLDSSEPSGWLALNQGDVETVRAGCHHRGDCAKMTGGPHPCDCGCAAALALLAPVTK